jgi:hypothetical protein
MLAADISWISVGRIKHGNVFTASFDASILTVSPEAEWNKLQVKLHVNVIWGMQSHQRTN